ncbi:MAG: hypothetical protein KGJ13_12650, partial [Patescibacteria group bacterium]|nr:hypothetical protein [Patescibacteria group bacterium]
NLFSTTFAHDAKTIKARSLAAARRKAEALGFGPTPLGSKFSSAFDVEEIGGTGLFFAALK